MSQKNFMSYGDAEVVFTEVANAIKSLDPEGGTLDTRLTEVEKVIPALNAGKIVICDRFVDSSLVYQGVARGLGIEEVYRINRFAIDDYMPEKTIYLQVDAETGLSRLGNREFKDRLDQEQLSFHQMVENGYQKIIGMFPERFIIIDAAKSASEVIEDAYNAVKQQLEKEV